MLEGRGSERLWTFLCVLRKIGRKTIEGEKERERHEELGVIQKIYISDGINNFFLVYNNIFVN